MNALRVEKKALALERAAYYQNPVLCPCGTPVPFLSWRMRSARYCSNWCAGQHSAEARRGVSRK